MKYVKPFKLYEDLLRRNQGRFLGLCLHDKHVHLAVSDPDNIVAVPLSAINRDECNMDLMADKFRALISEHNSTDFVVDYPYNGVNICRGAKINEFINDLRKIGKLQGLKYTYWEDVIVTKHMDFVVKHHADFILENLKPNLESTLKQMVKDMVARKFVAARLLQGYLDCMNTTSSLDQTIKG